MYIHVRIPFNFTTVFNTKQAIAGVYDQLLAQHDEPFKSITKSVTDVSLSIIEGSLEEFRDIIKALPQKTEISTPGRPKCFIAIGISIADMAMSTFNTVRITQLNEEISTLKETFPNSDWRNASILLWRWLHNIYRKTNET